jgi:uncharacterized protein YndB with AHSA1/START domain
MTSSGSDRILGSLRSAGDKGVVRIEDRYDTDIDDLWSALTDPRRLARWFGEVEGDLRLGGAFHARIPGAGDRTGRVDTCQPPLRLALTMRDPDAQPGQPDEEAIETTLTADGNQTILVIEVQGMPLDIIAFYGAGWQIHAENLARHIAGLDRDDTEARWDELVPHYQALAAKISA